MWQQDDVEADLCRLLAGMTHPACVARCLEILCTPRERTKLTKRLAAIQLVRSGASGRAIARHLRAGRETAKLAKSIVDHSPDMPWFAALIAKHCKSAYTL